MSQYTITSKDDGTTTLHTAQEGDAWEAWVVGEDGIECERMPGRDERNALCNSLEGLPPPWLAMMVAELVLERAQKSIAADTHEACAAVCDDLAGRFRGEAPTAVTQAGREGCSGADKALTLAAEAIRARSTPTEETP